MKSKQELKDELHQLIDNIEDEETLNVLNDDVLPYVIDNRTNKGEEELTGEQEKQLDEAIRQADIGETVSWQDFLKATERWRTK